MFDGREIGFKRTVADATDNEFVELARISCGDNEYFVQAVYASKSIYDKLAISGQNALISSSIAAGSSRSTDYDCQNLKVLETEEGVSFNCYDTEGNVVEKKVLIEQLKVGIQAGKEAEEQETKLIDSVKDVIRDADFTNIISEAFVDLDMSDIKITGQEFGEDGEIEVIIDKKHSRYYAEFSVRFLYQGGEREENGTLTYEMIVILDNDIKILKYGEKIEGYMDSDSGRCLLRDDQENLYYYSYDSDKLIGQILLTKQDSPKYFTADYENDFIWVSSYDGVEYVFDLDGNLLKECRAFNYGNINNQSVRMLIPSDNLNKVKYYDENWRLIDTVDISFMKENIQSAEAMELVLVSGGLIFSNDM